MENRHRVQLVEAASEGVVERGPAVVDRLPADKPEAGGTAGEAYRKAVRGILLGIPEEGGGKDHDFVHGREGGQHPGAPDDDPPVGLLHHPGGQEGVGLPGRTHRPVGLGVNKGVGEAEVVFPDVLVVAADVGGKGRLPVAQKLGPGGVGRHRPVKVIGGPAHKPEVVVGPAFHHPAHPPDILRAPGHKESEAHLIPAGRRIVKHLVGVFPLEVVKLGQGGQAVFKGRVGGRVVHPLPPVPEVPGVGAYPAEKFGSGYRAHCRPYLRRFRSMIAPFPPRRKSRPQGRALPAIITRLQGCTAVRPGGLPRPAVRGNLYRRSGR